MADGPVANLPAGLDAYAGYVNKSGIGITFPQVVAKFPTAQHLSITTNSSPAMCADVERGAMSNWTGYQYGYCAVSNVNTLIAQYGRPAKLWTAHYTGYAHRCSPVCWPGLVTIADGTQWTEHGGLWDESLLSDDFFGAPIPAPLPPLPLDVKEDTMSITALPNGGVAVSAVGTGTRTNHLLVFTLTNPTNPTNPGYNVLDVTAGIGTTNPYEVESA
jgi:hypothetical protein